MDAQTAPQRPRMRLPSRPWIAFWTALAGIAGTAAFDQLRLRQVRQDLAARAAALADTPLAPDELPRRIVVFIEPTHWARHWYGKYVKPVLDAAALDVELVEPEHAALVRSRARNALWKAREMLSDKALADAEAHAKAEAAANRSWLSWAASFFYVKSHVAEPRLPPALRQPKYDPSIGLVAVGPLAWRHMLLGVVDGTLRAPDESQTADDPSDPLGSASEISESTQLVAAVDLPPLGYISAKDQSGWSRFPSRLVSFLTQHRIAQQVGQDALIVAFEKTRPFARGIDERRGADDLTAIAEPKKQKMDPTPAEIREAALDNLNRTASKIDSIDEHVASRLRVYS